MVTGTGVTVAVEALVEVFNGIEMKELQNFVAEALRAGLCRTLTTSFTTSHVERPRAARSSGLWATGVPCTLGASSAENKRADNFTNAIIMKI